MIATLLLAAVLVSADRRAAPDPLPPREYASPSGEWRLHVDPSQRFGEGPAHYRLERSGELLWSADLSFTVNDAVVDDEGYLAGFAYTKGYESVHELGAFVIVLVSPAGRVIAQHATERKPSPHLHGVPDPTGVGIALDADHGQFLVRLANPDGRDSETWLVHDLRTGEPREALRPLADRPDTRLFAVLAVPDRPLYAVLGMVSDYSHEPDRHDLTLDLIDLEGKTRASSVFPGELEPGVEGGHPWDLWQRTRDHGLFEPVPGGFSAWLPRSGVRIDLEAIPTDAGWTLEEVGRSAFDPTPPAVEPPRAAPAELRHLGDVTLDARGAENGPLRKIRNLGFDELGRLMAVGDLDEGGRCATVVLLDPSSAPGGEVILERRVCLPERPGALYGWWPFESGRWLATCSWDDERFESRSAAWWVDPSTGELRELSAWSLPGLWGGPSAVASTGDGGLVACASWIRSNVAMTTLGSFDAEGRDRWRIEGPVGRAGPGGSLATDGIAVTREGSIVAVSSVGKSLQTFGRDGTWLETIDLAALCDATFPSGVETLPSGGLLVMGGGEERPVLRLSENGELLGWLAPRMPESEGGHLYPRVKVAPNGALWTTDGRAVMRLGPDGVVDRTLLEPDREVLHGIADVIVDRRQQRIVIADERSGTLFVFDPAGSCLARMELAPEDRDAARMRKVAAGPDGSVYTRTTAHPQGWIAFEPSGQRTGPVDLGRREVLFTGDGRRWTWTLVQARLLGRDGDVLATIERRADNRWLAGVADLDVARDGSVAILERPETDARVLTLYAPDGTPRSDHALPGGVESVWHVVHLGGRVIVHGFEGPVWILNVEQDEWQRCDPAWANAPGILLDASPSEDELWAFESSAGRFRRYALPKE